MVSHDVTENTAVISSFTSPTDYCRSKWVYDGLWYAKLSEAADLLNRRKWSSTGAASSGKATDRLSSPKCSVNKASARRPSAHEDATGCSTM